VYAYSIWPYLILDNYLSGFQIIPKMQIGFLISLSQTVVRCDYVLLNTCQIKMGQVEETGMWSG
jgi:hypothetical protein